MKNNRSQKRWNTFKFLFKDMVQPKTEKFGAKFHILNCLRLSTHCQLPVGDPVYSRIQQKV